jgi:hypothetical protein
MEDFLPYHGKLPPTVSRPEWEVKGEISKPPPERDANYATLN